MLDVGSRRSPYTIGLDAEVTLLDVPRTDVDQGKLDLGASNEIVHRTRRRRSNIVAYRLEDFLANTLEDRAFQMCSGTSQS